MMLALSDYGKDIVKRLLRSEKVSDGDNPFIKENGDVYIEYDKIIIEKDCDGVGSISLYFKGNKIAYKIIDDLPMYVDRKIDISSMKGRIVFEG